MFKVFRRKSKKTISSPQKVRSQSTSAHHDSHGVAGIGDSVRPLSYHFGTNDDLEAGNSRYSSLDFSSFRNVDDAPQAARPVERKTSLKTMPRESFTAESNGLQQASSMDDLLGDTPGNKQRRRAPCPPQRFSSLDIEDFEEAASDCSSPRLKAICEIRQSSDYDSSSDVENKPPHTNGHGFKEPKREPSLSLSSSSPQPVNPHKPLHPRNSSPTANVPNDVKSRDIIATDKPVNIKVGVQSRATLDRIPAIVGDSDIDNETLEVDTDLDLTFVTSLPSPSDRLPDNLSPNLTSRVTSDSESENETRKTQTFMESLMSSTAAALPAGSGVPFTAVAATKNTTKTPATPKSEESSVLSFRDAMKKSRLNSQSSVNGALSPRSPTLPRPLLSTQSRSDNPTPPPRKPRKGRTPKSPLVTTQSFSLDRPVKAPMQRSMSEFSSVSQASVSSDQSSNSSNDPQQDPTPKVSSPLAITVSSANDESKVVPDILQDVDEPTTTLSVTQNSRPTQRSDSGISSVDLEDLVVRDIRIDKPSNQEVMVVEDYTMHQEAPAVEKLEPWEMSMVQAWEAAVADRNDEVFQEDETPRNDRHMSSDSDEIPTTRVWQTRAPSSWTNEDIVEWCVEKNFGSLAELLADCGIDGEQFLAINDEDLVEYDNSAHVSESGNQDADLHLNEATRKKIINEIDQLKSQDNDSFTYIKQASMRRRNLEASNEALFDNLQSLQKLNTEQQESISSYLGELQQEQERTTHLLAEVSQIEDASKTLTRQVSQSMDDLSTDQYPSPLTHRQTSLTDISKSDAESASLWKELPLVKWTPVDVLSWMKAVDLDRFIPSFTNKLEIKAIEDRELILSKLYELQHSFDEASSNRTSSPNSSYGKSSAASSRGIGSYHQSGGDESSQMPRHEKYPSPNSLQDVEVWHELRGAFNVSTVSISTDATTEDLIVSLLDQLNLIEDPNLYGLQSVTLDPRYPGMITQHIPPITNQIHGMRSSTKTFRISQITTCAGVARLACRRFKCSFSQEDVILTYMSAESDHTGSDYVIAKDAEIAVNLDVDHLYLRERRAISHHRAGISEKSHLNQQAIDDLKEEISMLTAHVKERDHVIESLEENKQEMGRNIRSLTTKQLETQKLQQTAEAREKTWQDKCHRLQRELDRLKKIESYADPRAKVQILEAELKEMTEQVNTQEKNRKHMQQAVNKKRSVVDGASADDRRLEELITQLRKAEMTLLILKQEQDSIDVHLQLAKSHLEKMHELAASGPPIYKALGSSSFNVVPCEIPLTSSSLGFLHGRDENGNLVIKHAEDKSCLEKGDRVLEVSGTIVSDLSDLEFSRLLRKASGKLEMVVLRPVQQQQQQQHQPEILKDMQMELQGVKDDLALVVMDLDSAQLENQEFNQENRRLKDRLITMEAEREEFKMECVRISKQLAESERHKLELQAKQEQSNNEEFHSNGHAEMTNGVLAYGELEVSVPLWQSLASSPKTMILQALKDHILETTQQKAYLDHLISAVLQTNPELLSLIDQQVGLHDRKAMQLKASTEEFC
ncbi:hypothetical protein CAPTEDRAFT_206674 [Capitella teleta]|uniref:PDZ domain-containing protein n=1 Tax=Capitella teleta TaxID=283909 RepID=R7UDL0_CAPTE|nr:hypothetical protein CAPTEDRAFT_206674 [Capitella teleta]|eukprot:ELU04069.1 hypothetical protein CAPTEDRAFT_206674 [Capitella teleta]